MSLIATVFTKSSVIGACAARAAEFKRKGADSPKATAIRSRLMWVLPVLSPKRLEKNSVPSQRDSSVEVPKSSGGSTDARADLDRQGEPRYVLMPGSRKA